MASKAEKLIDRGSEDAKVASAAGHVSDLLIRMYLNQPKYFAEAIERAIPDYQEKDAEDLEMFFNYVGEYFRQHARGDYAPNIPHNLPAIRQWGLSDGCYRLLRVFAVLSCDLPYCAEHMGCWETRRAFCAMDGRTPANTTGE